jgi:hypothetical protein
MGFRRFQSQRADIDIVVEELEEIERYAYNRKETRRVITEAKDRTIDTQASDYPKRRIMRCKL